MLGIGANGGDTEAALRQALAIVGTGRVLGLVTTPASATSDLAMRRLAAAHGAVAYLNQDVAAEGPRFGAGGSPSLRAVVRDVYIPARYPGAKSHLSESRAALQFPAQLLRGFLRRIRIQYFVRDFSAVSLYVLCGSLLTLFGGIWGAWHFFVSSQTGVVATTGTVMIAVLPIIVGVQLLLQALTLDVQGSPTTPIHATAQLVKGEYPLDR